MQGEVKSTEWEGWLYCSNPANINGWVPLSYLSEDEEKEGYFVMLRDYDATELTVEEGRIVSIAETAASWAWVTCEDGGTGWVPLENLQYLDPE